jgi:predicted permease
MGLLNRLAGIFRRKRLEGDLDDEFRLHIELKTRENIEGGISPEEARLAALRAFGGVERRKEQCRDADNLRFVEDLLQDVLYGVRQLRRNPGFTAVAAMTLALGIGANTAIFSVIYAVMLRPLPYRNPERLAVLWTDNVKQNLHEERTSYPNFEDWRRQSRAFEDMAFSSNFTVNLTGGDEPERILAARNSANLFSLMGVRPLLGRPFTSQEEERSDRVIVLSYGLWQRHFGGSKDAIGRTLEIDGANASVVGVMPSTFQFPTKGTELWEPLTLFPGWASLKTKRKTPTGFVVGRLKPGFAFSQAQADMNVIGSRLARQYPELARSLDFFGFGVNVVPFEIYVTGRQVRVALWLLFGAVVLVLLIACTNVANLLLSHGVARARELAIRTALGAGKSRVIRQLLVESMLLYLFSGLLGIALATLGDRLLTRLAPTDIPRVSEAGLDVRVLIFGLSLSLLTAVLFGLTPALKASKTDPQAALKETTRASDTLGVVRLRSLFVVGELALALVLLAGAGLLIRSLLRVEDVDPGFRTDHLLTARVVQSKAKSERQWAAFYKQALERIGTIPGVHAAGAIDNFFLSSFPDEAIVIDGRPPWTPGSSIAQVTDDGASPGYFQAVGVPLLRGRFFTEEDGPDSPRVAIINQTMANVFWPNRDSVGQRFKFSYEKPADPWITIVGVVGDMRRDDLTRKAVSQVFLPLPQDPARGMDLVVQAPGDPENLAKAVRGAIRSVDKTAPVLNVSTVEDALREQLAPRRFQTTLLVVFATLALALSTIGIYGLTHYSVTQRTHEIGIRVALGARGPDILRMVVGQALSLTLAGISLGLTGASVLTRLLSSLLYGVSPHDMLTLAVVSVILAAAAATASCVPARRATKVDPMVALRYE